MFGNNSPSGAQIRALLGLGGPQRVTLDRPKVSFPAPRPSAGTIKATPKRSIARTIEDTTGDLLRRAGVDQHDANRWAGKLFGAFNDLTPVGDAVALGQAKQDLSAGNYWGAAINGLTGAVGAVPGAGDLGAGLLKAMFAGPMAKNANHAALRRAEEMAASGADRTKIWNNTGWFKGVDGKWRFEIDDSAATVRSTPTDFGREVWGKPFRHVEQPSEFMAAKGVRPIAYDGVLDHPQLEAAYGAGAFNPHISWEERADLSSGIAAGHLNVKTDRIEGVGPILPSVHHELQHSIQEHEGFARGGSSDEFAGRVNINGLDPYEQYRRLAGEVEARNVERRLSWPRPQRMATPPWLSQDIPDEDQIIRF